MATRRHRTTAKKTTKKAGPTAHRETTISKLPKKTGSALPKHASVKKRHAAAKSKR